MKWFKHDSDANRDRKLKKVLIRYGAEGYGLYWYCLELIAEPVDKHNLTFELEHDAEILANDLKIDTLKVEQMMRFMIDLQLFEECGHRITCLKLAKRIENSIVKSPQLIEIQKLLRSQEESGIIPDNPGQSGKVTDKLGLSGKSSENFGLDVDVDVEVDVDSDVSSQLQGVDDNTPPPCPIEKIITLYRKTRSKMCACREVSDSTRSNIRARWRSNPAYQKLEFWEDFFRYCEENRFLSGQSDPRPGQKPFVASLQWLVKPQNFAKVVNEEYS